MRGYVLVGGASARFGTDKASVPVDGVAMAERVALAMEAAGLEVRFVGKEPRWRPTVLEQGDRHPLRGVVAALEDARAAGFGGAVLAPCDLPFVPAEAFSRLLGARGAAVLSAGWAQPLCGVYPVSALDRARELLEQGGSVRAFAAEAERIAVPAPWLLNVNRPRDLGPTGG